MISYFDYFRIRQIESLTVIICKYPSKRKYFVLFMIVVLLKEVWRRQECPLEIFPSCKTQLVAD